MSVTLYIDETKAKSYVMVAVAVEASVDADVRRVLARLTLPGQRAPHMRSESDRRRREIVDSMLALADHHGLRASIHDAGRNGSERSRRHRCLGSILEEAIEHSDAALVFDRDESLVQADRQLLIELGRGGERLGLVSYRHMPRRAEALLALPDAIAWCWARGGDWRRLISPLVDLVSDVAL